MGGSRLWARYIEEQIAKNGVKPSRGQLYIKFYKLDKGDEKDRKLADLIRELEANGAPTAWGSHDSLAQALNKEEPRSRLRAGGVGKNKTLVYGSMRGSSAASISLAAPSSIAPSRDEFNKLLETVQQLMTHMASSQGSATQPPAYQQMPPPAYHQMPPPAYHQMPPPAYQMTPPSYPYPPHGRGKGKKLL
ncbi:hypothetical protein LINPERPRIM_LOCUS21633 [Linum perenne]